MKWGRGREKLRTVIIRYEYDNNKKSLRYRAGTLEMVVTVEDSHLPDGTIIFIYPQTLL